MKLFRSYNTGIFRNHRYPGLMAAIVVIISMIVGALTMSALAASYSSPATQSAQSSYDDHDDIRKEAEKQRKKALKQREKAMKQREAAMKQHEAAMKQHEEVMKQREAAMKQRMEAMKQREIARMQREAAKEQRKMAKKQREFAKKQREMAKKQREMAMGNSCLTVPIRKFSKITAGDNIVIMYTQGHSSGNIEIKGDQEALDQIDLSYERGTLNISYRNHPGDSNNRTVVYLTYPEIEEISLDDAASLSLQGELNTQDLKINSRGASSVNIPYLIGRKLKVSASDASQVTILTTETETIEAKASGASQIRLKGICSRTVDAKASDTGVISAIGRCNRKTFSNSDLGKVQYQGLIIENQKVDCNQSRPVRKMPRQP